MSPDAVLKTSAVFECIIYGIFPVSAGKNYGRECKGRKLSATKIV